MLLCFSCQCYIFKIISKRCSENKAKGYWQNIVCFFLFMPPLIIHYFRNMIIVFVVAIKREFIKDPEPDKHSYCHTHCQTADIDKRRASVFKEITPCGFEIIFKHRPLRLP